jgi:hypothetical protein
VDGFTTVYFHRPGEVADAGLHLDGLYTVEGAHIMAVAHR